MALSLAAALAGAASAPAAKDAKPAANPLFDIPETHRKLLSTRNFFVADPPPKPIPPIVEKKEKKKEEEKPIYIPTPPARDPADTIVLTGAFQLGDSWAASVEDLEGRHSQLISVGDTVPGAPDWQVASISSDRVWFQVKGRTAEVALGANLTGRNTAKAAQLLASGRPAAVSSPAVTHEAAPTTGIPVSSPGSASARPATPAMAEDRINLKSGITEPDAGKLREYLREQDERPKKGKRFDRG